MNKLLWMLLSALLVLPATASAEVYKWKDKTGVIRYSDTPPPSNVEQLSVNGKKPATASKTINEVIEGAEGVEGEGTAAVVAPPIQEKKKPANKASDAAKRQADAEVDKKKSEQVDAELKQKQQNCANAKTNYSQYKMGGRMAKMGDKGEREYLTDAEVAQGLEQAKNDMNQFCE